MHMPRSGARLDHLPTSHSHWPWFSHNDTRISNLETEHMDIKTKLDQLETKLDTLSNKIDDPSGTRNSESTETSPEGGDTTHDSTPHSLTAHMLREDLKILKQQASKSKSKLEALKTRNTEDEEDQRFDHSRLIEEEEAEYNKLQEQINAKEELFHQAHADARTAGEPPMLKSGPSAQHSKELLLTNGAQSRYAVRIPR
jgi:peptidoglycan hydrolase CwlO-like protein